MYYNLVCHYGPEKFYRDAAGAGVNSVLIADLCIDDADEVQSRLAQNGLDSVYMVTPNTSPARREKIARLCTGFIYAVSVLGVTGARRQLGEKVIPLISALKQQTAAPICVGFGVSRPEHARRLAEAGADGVIVGSALVKIIENNPSNPAAVQKEIRQLIGVMKDALASSS